MATAVKKGKVKPVMKSIPVKKNVAKPEADQVANTNGAGTENLDKVRDLLFGNQMRDSEKRLNKIEERLASDLNDLREDNRKRFESLEALLKKEIQSLVEKIKSEQTTRNDAIKGVGQDIKAEAANRNEAIKGVSQEIRDAVKAITEQIREGQDKAAEMDRDIRQELADASKTMREELQAVRTAASSALDASSDELRDSKADRTMLADLFSEFADRLSAGESGK